MTNLSAANECGLCRSIEALRTGGDGYSIARTRTGYVTIFYCQYFKGHTVFMSDRHVTELHQLDPDVRALHLDEMARIAEVIYRIHNPRKLNYALLGNIGPHLHWSLIPRYADDAEPGKSPWEDPGFWKAVADPAARDNNYPSQEYVERFLAEMEANGVAVEERFPAHS